MGASIPLPALHLNPAPDLSQEIGGVTITYQSEGYSSVLPELKSLLPLHWEEIALDKDKIKLAPDYERYLALEKAGILHVITARCGTELVGYHISFVTPHMHYSNDLMCFTDIFFLKREYRKGLAGLGLFRAIEREMRKLGVKKLVTGCKVHLDLGVIFRRLGWTMTDHLYAKYIG